MSPTVDGVLWILILGGLAITLGASVDRWVGFASAAAWSTLPLVSGLLPEGWGLVLLNSFLALNVFLLRLRTGPIRMDLRPWIAAMALGGYVVLHEMFSPALHPAGPQLLAAVLAGGLLGLIGSAVCWRKGFALGLISGGLILATAEVVRVASGGSVHAQTVSFDLNPIQLAQYSGVALLVITYKVSSHAWTAWAILPGVLALAGIIATGSRGPLLGAVIAAGYVWIRMAFFGVRRRRLYWLYGIACMALLGVIAASRFGVDLQEWLRIDDADGNTSSRVAAWDGAMATIWESPWLGAGANNYFHGSPGSAYGAPDYPHNLPLEAWAEYGIVAFGLLMLATVRAWSSAGHDGRPFIAFALVSFGLSGSLDRSLVLWVCLGLAGSIISVRAQDSETLGLVSER